MKKKILLIIFIIIVVIGSFIIGRQVGLNTEDDKTQTVTREETVSNHDIKKTLSATGTVSAKTTEKITLATTKYFKAMCVEEDDTVKTGENILQYTNGTYLVAPYDCVIISLNLPETENKCTSSNYIEVSNLDTLTTTISINENEINEVAVGQEVEIKLTADESKTYTGKITKLDSVGNYQASGTTFSATIEFENDDTIKLGMSTSCTVILKEEKEVLAVPIDSVLQNSEGEQYVNKVKEDGTLEEVIVETGIADESYVQITSGLSLNDKIQIETELTESTTNSDRNNQGGFGNFGGGMNDKQGGTMPEGAGQMPDMKGDSQMRESGQAQGNPPKE